MKKIMLALSVTFLSFVFLLSTATASNKQVIAGAGPSTKVVELFFSKLSLQPSAKDYEFVVPAMSTKHAGGITNTDRFLFGRTGHALTEAERAMNKKEILLAKVPIAFASGGGAKIPALSIDAIEKIFRKKINKWTELGGADIKIITVGREPTEALFMELKQDFPFFQEVKFDIVLKTDDEVVKLLKSPLGEYAIAFGAKPNFTDVRTLDVKGKGNVGILLGLVYDKNNENDPLVKAASIYAASDEWRRVVADAGLFPVKK